MNSHKCSPLPVCPLCEEALHDQPQLIASDFKCGCPCHPQETQK